MKKVLIASGVAVLALAMVAGAQGYSFSTNLTVGSTGADVVALQTWLISNGFNIPSIASGAAAKGYFGSQTKSAVVAYQTSVGLPSTGFVGPLTRAKLNAGGGSASTGVMTCPAGYTCTSNSAPVVQCPAGYTCTANPGTTGTTVTGSGATGITTPGVPGIMSVTAGPLSSAVINVGAQMVPVLTVRVQAQYSDLAVQSLNLDLGNNTAIYNKIFNKIYVTDGTNVLASQALNSGTVIQSGSDYIVGLNGFNFIVPKGTYKDIIIKADTNTSIDSAYLSGTKVPGTNGIAAAFNGSSITSGVPSTGWGIGLSPSNGVRAVDGAGINLNNGSGFAQALTINASLVDNAQANISLDPASPLVNALPVTDTTNNQYLGLPVAIIDINAQNDNLHLHEMKVNFSNSGPGTITAAYLYQGSTQITSASVSNGQADFANITDGTNGASIPVNTTVPFTVKADVTGVTGATTITATASSTLFTVYNSIDSTAVISGQALGNAQTVSGVGPLITLSGAPSMDTPTNITPGGATVTTYRYTAHFNLNVQAVGADVSFGTLSSTTLASFGSSTTGSNIAQVLAGGIASTTLTLAANYYPPTNTTVNAGGDTFTVSRNQTVSIPVTYSFTVVNPGAQTFQVQLQGVTWNASNGTNGPSTFMKNQTAWRTDAK